MSSWKPGIRLVVLLLSAAGCSENNNKTKDIGSSDTSIADAKTLDRGARDSAVDRPPASNANCRISMCSVNNPPGTACCFAEPRSSYPICCTGKASAVMTWACDPMGKVCFDFCSDCLPLGWKRAQRPEAGVPPLDAGPDRGMGACLIGASFAHCPGAQNPALFCNPGSGGDCLWVSTGKPLGKHTQKVTPSCAGSVGWFPLGRFLYSYGDQPWTRSRAMNLSVTIDSTLPVSANAVNCSSCKAPWAQGDTACSRQVFTVIGRPGTLVVTLHPGGLYGWALELELDITAIPPRARACRTPFTDALWCKVSTVTCADSGKVTLSAAPTATNLRTLTGTFSATFGSDTISGSFKPTPTYSGKPPCK